MNEIIKKWYENNAAAVTGLSDKMFQNPEVALDTFNACKWTAEFMRGQGFAVEEIDVRGKGGTPNGVIAKFGSGKPVIGILGEFDSLPGLGNEVVPYQSPLPESTPGPGHGCGHHLMGAGCAASAAALKASMEDEKISGTLIYFGCPAEETLDGKVYMAKAGLFDDLDICLAWHPEGTAPHVMEESLTANTSIVFDFHGKTAHAASNPTSGRSALDAAEIMNVGVNYLREHVSDDVRMHYCYLAAGEKPNIVPDFASLHYYIRGRNHVTVDEVLERVKECARGAAIITGTTTDNHLVASCYETLINHTLNKFMYNSLKKIPEIAYDEADIKFAKEIYKNATGNEAKHNVLPTETPAPTGIVGYQSASTDVGDVSHIVPTVQAFGGGVVSGLALHHWAATATAGSPIGHKAEIHAGKILAQTAYDIFKDQDIIEEAWKEFREARKDLKPYSPGVPEV